MLYIQLRNTQKLCSCLHYIIFHEPFCVIFQQALELIRKTFDYLDFCLIRYRCRCMLPMLLMNPWFYNTESFYTGKTDLSKFTGQITTPRSMQGIWKKNVFVVRVQFNIQSSTAILNRVTWLLFRRWDKINNKWHQLSHKYSPTEVIDIMAYRWCKS